jgi:hypothetical protein
VVNGLLRIFGRGRGGDSPPGTCTAVNHLIVRMGKVGGGGLTLGERKTKGTRQRHPSWCTAWGKTEGPITILGWNRIETQYIEGGRLAGGFDPCRGGPQ